MAVNVGGLSRRQFARWLDRILPQECALCGGAGGPGPLCAGCRADLPRSRSPCPLCGCSQRRALAVPCAHCLREPPPWRRARIPFRYEWPLDALVAAVKFGRRLALAAALGELLAAAAGGDADTVVPVPLHPWRLAGRGFNQAAELAAALAWRRGLALRPRLLRRVRATRPQSGLAAPQRHRNVRGAFVAAPEVAARRIMLVDDVVTTGSTAAAATRACLRAGAREVVLVALARA